MAFFGQDVLCNQHVIYFARSHLILVREPGAPGKNMMRQCDGHHVTGMLLNVQHKCYPIKKTCVYEYVNITNVL